MALLGHVPAQPKPPFRTFNDGTVHHSRLPGPIDPTAVYLEPGTRFVLPVSAGRIGREAIWFAPGARRLAGHLADNDFVIDQLKQNPKFKYRPKTNLRKRRVVDSQGRAVGAEDVRYAVNGHAIKRAQKEVIDRIRGEGFVRRGGLDQDGSPLAFIDEIGDRSAHPNAALLRRLLQLMPRRPMAGVEKSSVRPMDKRLALYCNYIELNRKIFAVERIDLDLVFESMAHIDRRLDEKVRNGEIPFKPHMIVAKERSDGAVARPHALIFLPIGEQVNMDRRRRRGVRQLVLAVRAAWIRSLESLGADRGGAANAQRIKNPFCPGMTVGILQQHKFMKLSKMAAFFRKRDPKLLRPLDRDDGEAKAVLGEAGIASNKESNDVFLWARTRVWQVAFAERARNGETYKSWMLDRTQMRWGLYNQVIGEARPRSWGRNTTEKHVTAVVASVARNCAVRFNEDACWEIVNRGAMAGLLDDTMSTKTKQRLSGPWSAQQNARKKIDAVVDAILKIETREGRRVSKPFLISELNEKKIASRSTLYKLWDAVRSLVDCESETVDGKKVINNAANCTGPSAGSPDQHEVLPECIGALERMVLTAGAHVKDRVRPSDDLHASAYVRTSKGSPPTCKADDGSTAMISCSKPPQVPAEPEPSPPYKSTVTDWAAPDASEDPVLRLMQVLSKLRDAPSSGSLAGGRDSFKPMESANNRMETIYAGRRPAGSVGSIPVLGSKQTLPRGRRHGFSNSPAGRS